MSNRYLFFVLTLTALLMPNNAYAYLDMGTGSMILQVLVASLAACALFLKAFWGRIKSFFSKNKSNNDVE